MFSLGGSHVEQGQAARLAKKLRRYAGPADLWLLDEYGVKIETVGGCDEASGGQDDKRIKSQWWYDRSAVGQL